MLQNHHVLLGHQGLSTIARVGLLQSDTDLIHLKMNADSDMKQVDDLEHLGL